MANAKGKHRKQRDLLERAQAWVSLLSASLLSADELIQLIEHIVQLIHLVVH
jgi:hypothetical protein